MAVQFVWKDEYSVGNKKIDKQHKQIFALANSLTEVYDQYRIKHTIMDLFKYARKHFSDEEKMMEEIGYPKLEEHRQIHLDMIERLTEISQETFDCNESIYDFKKFIYDWMIDHVLEKDMDYFHFTHDRNS